MSEELKNAFEDFGKGFDEFKKTNDERLELLEKGEGTAYVDEKLSKIEEKLASVEDMSTKLNQAQETADNIKEQVDKLETVIKRPNSGLDTKQIDETHKVFDSYIRKGKDALSDAEKKALTVSNDSTGGFLAPPEYVRELLKTVTEISPIRQIARIRSTGQRSIQVP